MHEDSQNFDVLGGIGNLDDTSNPITSSAEKRKIMKINFNQPIKNIRGEEIKDLMLKTVSVDALLATFPDEQSLSGEEKAKRYVLATRIYANPKELDLTVEEVAKIKQLIGKGYGPLIVGQAWDMLEGNKA